MEAHPPTPRFHPRDDPEFWLRHVRFGVWLSLGTLALTGPYLWLSTDSDPLLGAVILATVVVTVLIRSLPWQRMLQWQQAMWLFYGWSSVITVLITVAAAVDGGIDSPLLIVYALPMLFAAVAYPPRAVLAIGISMVAAVCAMAVVTGVEDPGRAWLTISVFALATWTFAYAATNHRRSAAATRRLAEQLAEQVNVDGLTGCLNHRAFQERLTAEVARAQRSGASLGLLLGDVDHFKAVNDHHGHQVGDQLLATVAATLRRHVRLGDDVARIGGEEFAVLLPGADVERCVEVAERLRRQVGSVEQPVPVTISFGVAVLPEAADTGPQLLQQADAGLYAAKARGRDTVAMAPSGPTEGPVLPHRRTGAVRTRVTELLESDALHAVFQPIVDLASGQVVAYESLARVHGSKLRPDQWLELAEESGQRPQLEGAMLDAALDAWEQHDLDVRLFVNLSPVAIAAGVPWPRIERFGRGVVIEVSERDPVDDYTTLRATLDDLREHGVGLAIDDVGAGHANMRHVLRLAPAYLKVDRSFVASIDRHAGQAALMRSITGFTDDLGIRVIAEGIERGEEGEVLREIGVGYGQGWLVARPDDPPPAPAWPPTATPEVPRRAHGMLPSRRVVT